jgi:hypothetical protein
MPDMSTEALRMLARRKFGRDLTDAELTFIASLLAEVADRLLKWQSRLGDIEPATTYRVTQGGPR